MRPFPKAMPFLLAAAATLVACGGGGGGSNDSSGTGGSDEPYAAMVYGPGEIDAERDVAYSTRPNIGGDQYTSSATQAADAGRDELTLTMDIYSPPSASGNARLPAVVWIHGGAFVAGSKDDRAAEAVTYARAGYVGVSIDYRLTDRAGSSPARMLMAVTASADDTMNAIRYLKANAAALHLDPDRIAVIGTSAGGGLALIEALDADDLDGTTSDYGGVSAKVAAAISTGATLNEDGVDATGILSFDATDTSVLLFHAKETDGTTGATWTDNAVPTCELIAAGGTPCSAVPTPDGSHTVDLSVEGDYWSDVWPFLSEELGL